MINNLSETFEMLFDKNNSTAYHALQKLQIESDESNSVYIYMDRLSDMLENDNSYIRARGIILIACNAKWDQNHKVDEIIDKYLKHITDDKPITARQCIKRLPMLAKDKPELKETIILALQNADISIYKDSMQPLVYQDIRKALSDIRR